MKKGRRMTVYLSDFMEIWSDKSVGTDRKADGIR